MKSEFLTIMKERGFIHQLTNETALDHHLSTQTVTAYIGFDATAPSLHVGSLVQIMMLRWLQKTGHRPLILMGGGTSRIGDPSFKDDARQLLTDEKINQNIRGIQSCFSPFIQFGQGKTEAVLLNNNKWLSPLLYIDFLRDIGRHFTVNRMLSFDSVKLRLDREQSLSFLEFNYMILQAYDFMELAKNFGCLLQMGGSDQWGNIVNGVDLTRKVLGREVFGFTTPLLTTSSGIKMGKTVRGAVWLNEEQLSSYDYWQFWRNTEDADVGRYLRLFTELPLTEIDKLESLEGADINEAKKILADNATALAHGLTCLPAIHQTAGQAFGGNSSSEISLEKLPHCAIGKSQLNQGFPLLEALCTLNFATSKGEARRLVQGKGVRVNDEVVEADSLLLTTTHLLEGNMIKISAGKKRHGVVRVT